MDGTHNEFEDLNAAGDGMRRIDFSQRTKNQAVACRAQGAEIVEHPSHYHSRVSDAKMKHIINRIGRRGYIEAIDVIDAWNLNFNLGSALKYELRLGMKDDEITEIDKAIKYLEFEKEMRLANKE